MGTVTYSCTHEENASISIQSMSAAMLDLYARVVVSPVYFFIANPTSGVFYAWISEDDYEAPWRGSRIACPF